MSLLDHGVLLVKESCDGFLCSSVLQNQPFIQQDKPKTELFLLSVSPSVDDEPHPVFLFSLVSLL